MSTNTILVLVTFAFIGLAAWWNVSLWQECRQTNSFWYCVRVLGK